MASNELKGFILTRHWRDLPERTQIEYWLATEAEPVRQAVVEARAHGETQLRLDLRPAVPSPIADVANPDRLRDAWPM